MVKAHNLVDQREKKNNFFNKIFQTRQNLIDIYARKSQKKIRPKNMQTKLKKQRISVRDAFLINYMNL